MIGQSIRPASLHARWRLFRHHTGARWQSFLSGWYLFRRQPLGLLGVAIIIVYGIMAVLHPILMSTVWNRAVYDPIVGYDLAIQPHPTTPSAQHILGTDNFGRDVLSQLVAGAQTSFGVGILAGLVAVIVSTLLGATAAYFGGLVDLILMGISDVFVLMPAPIVMLIFGLLLRLEWPVVAIGYGLLTGLGGQAIVVKAQTLTVKARPFIEAAKLAGGGHGHIIRKHILPSLIPIAIVHGVFTVVGAVLTESLLSFFGRTSYHLSWGMMIWLGQETFRLFTVKGQWHAILPPALSIMLYCGAFYLVGRALDEVFNPRLRRR
ncbi:MAG: ABC transporter permease [Anaerolineae bacterium]